MSLFTQIKNTRLKRSKFDLSHEKKLSCNMGKLVPILNIDVIPGDSFNVNTEIFIRMSPMIAPIMHRVNVYTHYFYVPNRIVWTNWNDFIFGGLDGQASHVQPFIKYGTNIANSFRKGGLPDYMGIPPIPEGVTPPAGFNPEFNSLPFRAYQEIFNEYYADQNLSTFVEIQKDQDGEDYIDTGGLVWLRERAWEKDYLTSCLPWPQKGPDVELPTDIKYKEESIYRTSAGGNVSGAPTFDGVDNLRDATSTNTRVENIDSLGVTINDLRVSIRLQEWYEKMARGGSRAKEALLNMFGILSSDARLDRPEYLGGGKTPVTVSEVLNTTGVLDDGTTQQGVPQGNMSGHGIAVGARHGFRRKLFEEHGHVIGIMSILPKTAYMDSLPRNWTRQDKFDYFWKQFANIGEQEVLNQEAKMVWNSQDDTLNNTVFGYQSRYAEYKYQADTIHGDFRDNLDFWHMGRKFATQPALNEDFITSDPTNRIFAITDPDEHKVYAQVYHNFSALRPLPYFGTPRL